MTYLLEFWNLDHLLNMVIRPCVAKIRIFQKLILVFDKKQHIFTQKWTFFIWVDILISCPSLSRVLHNSSQKPRKIRRFSQRYIINVSRFAFFDFDMSSQNSEFFISVIFWSNFNWWTLFEPLLNAYATFFLLKFIFRKKLQVEVGYHSFFFLFSSFSFVVWTHQTIRHVYCHNLNLLIYHDLVRHWTAFDKIFHKYQVRRQFYHINIYAYIKIII